MPMTMPSEMSREDDYQMLDSMQRASLDESRGSSSN